MAMGRMGPVRLPKAYAAWGPVRGDCGHRHRSLRCAELCRRRDERACQGTGGHSDRYICYASHGFRLPLTPAERDLLRAVCAHLVGEGADARVD